MNARLNKLIEMLKDSPNDSFLKYATAIEYMKEKDINKAISIFEELVISDENYVGTYYQLGKLYEQVTLNEKAEEIYSKGILIAKKAGNQRTTAELKQALRSVQGLDYDE